MSDVVGLRVDITGIVQGVGFRPFVYRLAQTLGLQGWVRNTSAGVEIEVDGAQAALEAFARDLRDQAPPMARIETLVVQARPTQGFERFEIVASHDAAQEYQLISPDVATCPDCVAELHAPTDRRYRYPFTNCTNCGPRFTIIQGIPYDRPKTTMSGFVMCPDCQREYDDPLDRRFHAQPNACPVCGPQVQLLDAQGLVLAERDLAMSGLVERLLQGQIAAIKGLGGFQLACDATNHAAVETLRARKQRPHKPLAIMVRDMHMARRYAEISQAEQALLTSPSAPIVLVPWRQGTDIDELVVPKQRTIGIMLPYTPLHHLLLSDVDCPLVMTSGNLSEEPIAQDNDEAVRRLGHIADCFLVHDRDIHSRYDDSVLAVSAGGLQPLRRARGYAPNPIKLLAPGPATLACGPELKNTFCLTRDTYAFVSQHIGDMQNLETLEHYQRTLALYRSLFRTTPEIIAHDLHPDYLTTRLALEMPGTHVGVQHHHAHLVSCLADNGHAGPAIGVIWDGNGYGLDESIWGGEFLVGDAHGFVRAAHLQALPLPGGDQGVRNPYRIAAAYLLALGLDDLPGNLGVGPEEERLLRTMVTQHLHVTPTTSAGRLFDGVAALLGVRRQVSYEGQAAIEMEQMIEPDDQNVTWRPYRFALAANPDRPLIWGKPSVEIAHSDVIQLSALLSDIIADLRLGVPPARIAWRFHQTCAEIIRQVCHTLRKETGLNSVCLSGGCFQNRLLLSLLLPRLQSEGFEVLVHHQVPCNDGGVSLGQALIAQTSVQGD